MSNVYDHALESNRRFSSRGLSDEILIAPGTAAEIDAAFGYDQQPTDDEIDAMAELAHARQSYDVGGQGDDRPVPPAGALFPEVASWPDDHLTIAIDLCERRDTGLNLHAVGNIRDRHDAFLHACSAELVRRLEARGVRFAA